MLIASRGIAGVSMEDPQTPTAPHGSDSEISDGDLLANELDLLAGSARRRVLRKSPVAVASLMATPAPWHINC